MSEERRADQDELAPEDSVADGSSQDQVEATVPVPADSSGIPVHADPEAPASDPEPIEEPAHEMTFTEHLNELRVRLMRCLIGAFVGFLL